MHTLERSYEHAERIVAGLSAIEHLFMPLPPAHPVRSALDALAHAASEHHALARELNMKENGWVYGEDTPSPRIHPDYVDAALLPHPYVAVVDTEHATEIAIHPAGPFPMEVGDHDGEPLIVGSEEDLVGFLRATSPAYARVSPTPRTSHRPDAEANWRRLLDHDREQTA